MSRAWKDPDDVQQDMLDQQKEINALVRAISIKLDEQQRTNQLLEQILTELKNHFADGGKKVVCGLDEGDPKGDESVIIEKKIGEEEKPAEEKKPPLIIPYDLNGPRALCPLCSRECVFDKIETKYWCTHCRTHFDNPPKYEDVDPVCPKCGGPLCWHDLCSGGKYFCHNCKNYFKMEKGGGARETTAWGDGYLHGWNDSWYARSPRTEFDKWKENLKPEDLIFDETDPLGDPKTKWAVFNTSGNTCDHCPAQKICHELPGRGKCGPAFLQWAKTKVEE